jgi:hypothetical protein
VITCPSPADSPAAVDRGTTELPCDRLETGVLFPTHLVAGALLGTYCRLSVAWLVVGAALPDLLDKSLAALGVTALYHSVGHSALLAVLFVPLAVGSRTGAAVAAGWTSHLLLDAVHVVVNGRPLDALFLAWPVAVPPDPLALAPIPFALQYLWTPSFFLEIGIWLAAGAVFVGSGRGRRALTVDGR